MPHVTSFSFLFEDTSTEDTPKTSLNGTKWTALELPLNEEPTRDITLMLDSDSGFISGRSGCNKYIGRFEMLTDNSFRIIGTVFAKSKMFCEGLMEQERDYLNFMKSRTFFYEVTDSNELVLFDSVASSTSAAEELTQGDVLARYAKEADSDTQEVRRHLMVGQRKSHFKRIMPRRM